MRCSASVRCTPSRSSLSLNGTARIEVRPCLVMSATAGVTLWGYGQFGNVAPQGVHGPAPSRHKTKKTKRYRRRCSDVTCTFRPADFEHFRNGAGNESEVAVPPPSEPTAARTDRRENAGKLRRPETAAGCTVPVTAHHGLRGPLHRCPRGRERLRGPVPPGEEPAPWPPAPLELLRLAPLTARCRARRTDYGGGSPNNLR